MYTGNLGLAGASDRTLSAPFGGGTATLAPYVAPSLGLSYSDAIDAAGFGNDRAAGAPVVLTFDRPMSSVGVQFVYQDPQEDGRGTDPAVTPGGVGIRLSSGKVKATFYGPGGEIVGTTSGLTDGAQGGFLGGAFDGNLPQGAVRTTGPIASMTITMPQTFGSESWLSAAVPYGKVDYAALQADANARNAATAFADKVLSIARAAFAQLQFSDKTAAEAEAALAKSPQDQGWLAYVADQHSVLDDYRIALGVSVQDLQTIVSTNLASASQLSAAHQLLLAIQQAYPTLPAMIAAAIAHNGRPTAPTPPITPAPVTPSAYAPPTYAPPVVVSKPPEANVQQAPTDLPGTSPTIDLPLTEVTPYPYPSPTAPPQAPAVTQIKADLQAAPTPATGTTIGGGVLLAIAAVGLWFGTRKNRRREF